jgi:predicted dehydrogenase
MEKIKVGVIGCGGIANGKHLPALSRLDDVEIVAFCDIVEERAIQAKKNYGKENAKVYTDYKELLKDTEIVAIHVCTPNRSHSFISIDALEAGKNVICEKPMAISYKEAKAMVEASEKAGKLLTIGYQNRYRDDSLFLKKVCENDDLGEVYYAKAHAIRRRAVPTWGVFLNEYEQGGGPLIDIGTHALDMTLWFMDNYKPQMVVGSVFKKLGDQKDSGNAWGDWDTNEFTVEDSAFGFIKMENGATIVLESSWALNSLDVGEALSSLCGTKAGADMKDGLRINGVKYNKQYIEKPDMSAGSVAFFEGKKQNPEDIEARIFYNAINKGTELVVKPRQAMVVTQILESIYESAKTGQPIFFNE